MKKSLKLIIFSILLIICLSLASCSLSDLAKTKTETKTVVVSDTDVNIKYTQESSTPNNFEEAVGKVYDSVVVIECSNASSSSAGSGVIIGEGEEYTYIVTCCHVVEGYSDIDVTLTNGTKYSAVIKGADPITDLAVILIKKTGLTTAALIENSDAIAVGSDCFAIGNPLGTLGGTVTKGIISATSRNIKMSDGSVHCLLQTDAAINSGNSGGGLFNNKGGLIGIVSAKYSASGVEGLGFAIPANTVKSIITEIIEKGYVEGRTSLGVTISDGSYRTGYGFFGSYVYVVYVSYVDPDGSAYGLLSQNDIIEGVSVDFKDSTKKSQKLNDFENAEEVNNFLDSLNLQIGDTVNFTIRKSPSSSSTEVVSVTLKQYIYQ